MKKLLIIGLLVLSVDATRDAYANDVFFSIVNDYDGNQVVIEQTNETGKNCPKGGFWHYAHIKGEHGGTLCWAYGNGNGFDLLNTKTGVISHPRFGGVVESPTVNEDMRGLALEHQHALEKQGMDAFHLIMKEQGRE